MYLRRVRNAADLRASLFGRDELTSHTDWSIL